jgi:ABC-type antimicrobial peptide transport system permease subunit
MKKIVTIVGIILSTSSVFAQVSDLQRPGDLTSKLAEARRGRDTKIQDLDSAIADIQNVMNLGQIQNPEVRRMLRTAIFKIEDVQIKIYQEQQHGPGHGNSGPSYPDQNGPLVPRPSHGNNGPGYPDQSLSCPNNICIGDLVYLGIKYKKGGTVVAVNYNQRTATVRSLISGQNNQESLDQLEASRGCIMGACVGDTIYSPVNNYSLGATVLAVNELNRSVTVKSNKTGNLFVEDATRIQVTTQSSAYNTQQRRASNK